ncbi:MAG: hypothetical protein JZU65_17665, partial [Chlorobium sp.]|nr:hypothetical protein [Chlorobium sp.]
SKGLKILVSWVRFPLCPQTFLTVMHARSSVVRIFPLPILLARFLFFRSSTAYLLLHGLKQMKYLYEYYH